jgi:trimeric autotransporter adhesin
MKPAILLVVLVLCVAMSSAQIPRTMSYQGVLTDSTGAPKPDGSYSFTFRLYEASSGGGAVGTQQQTLQVKRGLFSTVFGQLLNGLSVDRPYWLSLQVESEPELLPRIPLTSVPYSISSIHSDTASYALAAPQQVSSGWSLTGNAGTTAGTNFVGTADGQAFDIRTNNVLRTRITTKGQIETYNTGQSVFIGEGAGANDDLSNNANVFVGYQAGLFNTTGFSNTANGYQALRFNTTGGGNTANGYHALFSNTTGLANTAYGYGALSLNTTNQQNTAVGYNALASTTASDFNTALGANAGSGWNNGYNNVFLGANVSTTQPDLYNVIAIGQGTYVTGLNMARFGNSATGSYGGWANWTNVSDGRYKKNVRENVPGIEFIKKLRPITYTLDATGLDAFYRKNDKKESHLTAAANAVHQRALREKEQIVYTGFVAQEVEAAARSLGFDFSGVDASKNENDTYGLRYAEFVVPLVKAVQEQQKMIEELKIEIDELKSKK